MDINNFIQKRPFVYHLTNANNLPLILEEMQILSTNQLISLSNLKKQDKKSLTESRRPEHVSISVGGKEVSIRDQRPISVKSLEKSLTHNWKAPDFIKHLNDRVFFWPTLKRLHTHFDRYEPEGPIILRVSSSDLLLANLERLRFCRLNSGATRCHHLHGGAPPPRGKDTFQRAADFGFSFAQVAEVTFEDYCTLPENIEMADSPDGPWTEIQIP